MLERHARRLAGVILVSLACLAAAPAQAAERARAVPSAEAMVVDALIVRPANFIATVLGTAAFVVSLPFSVAGGNVGEAADRLVADPARHTFGRPLGDLARDP